MASIVISKIKVRRGTDAQRKNIVLDQGELGYTTDTNRLYIGNGTINGGIVVGSKVHPPITSIGSLTSVVSEVGDIVWVNGIFYQLIESDYTTLNSWKNIGPLLDSNYFTYDNNNQITLKSNVLQINSMSPELYDEFKVNVDDISIEYTTGNILRLKDLGISKSKLQSYSVTNDKLSPDVVGYGLEGAGGIPISIKIDPEYFYFTSDGSLGIQLSSIKTYGDDITIIKNLSGGFSVKPDSIDQTYIKSSSFGNGLSGGSGEPIFVNVDTSIFDFNSNLQLKLNTNSINENFIKSETFGKGLLGGNGTKATLNIDPTVFKFNDLSALSLLSASIDRNYIASTSFGQGIIGGNGSPIQINVLENLFDFETGKLTLSANSITEKYLNSGAFGVGLEGGDNQKITIAISDPMTFTDDLSGTVRARLSLDTPLENSSLFSTLSNIYGTSVISLSDGIMFPKIKWDQYGRMLSIENSIVEALTGTGLNSGNVSNIFNGSIVKDTYTTGATFSAKDHNNNTYILSSAGFIAISPTDNISLSGQMLKRFAIPVFAY